MEDRVLYKHASQTAHQTPPSRLLTRWGETRKMVKQWIKEEKMPDILEALDVRALNHVREREKAEIAFFISLEQPTPAMVKDASSVGFYTSVAGKKFPRVQLLTSKVYSTTRNAPSIPITSRICSSRKRRRKQQTSSPKKGEFMDVKKDGKPFKGVAREPDKRRK